MHPATDPFAPGNEAMTPPELHSVTEPDADGWRVRAFENLYPALERAPSAPAPEARADLYSAIAAAGAHEVIVNSSRAVTTLAELSLGELTLAVETWRTRMRAHPQAACLHLVVNEGRAGGTSIDHTHAQLYALDFVPALIARERERFGSYATRTMGQNLLADLLAEEVRRRERVVAIDADAVLLAPFAARLPYELMIVPRAPRARFEDDGATGAGLLHEALARLRRRHGTSPPLNIWVRTAPRGAEHFCWHIDVLPRLSGLAGLELGTGVHLNSVTPEQAAAELRAA